MPQFYINARIVVDCGKEIGAASMEDALEKSKKMKWDDFISIDCDHNDSDMVIDGVNRAYRRVKL
jgi:hypothetical protein